jgi:tetratricopeptide (TPR) repeat protein
MGSGRTGEDSARNASMNDEAKAAEQSGGINIGGGQADVRGDLIGRDQVTINQYRLPGPATAAMAPHQLPPPPRDFTGRKEELDELRAAIEKGGVTISGLQGLGGVGKTALALKLAEELKPRYPDAQFYLDMKGVSKEPISAKDAMGYMIRSLYPDIKLPENEAALAGMYQSMLYDKRAILVLDNAKDEAQVEPLIPPASCLLLVTSRQHFTLAGLEAKNLDALSPADARSLILSIAKRLAKEQRDYAGELARLCGNLPLALRSVAKVLTARIDLNPADYVRKLADARERLKETAADASLSLSYELLTPELQRRFRSLAVFPDTFDLAASTAVWDVEPGAGQDSLGELGLSSLLEFNSATSRYRLHDLVRIFADAHLDSDERSVSQRCHAVYYKLVADKANQLYLRGGESLKEGLALYDLEWMSIEAGLSWATTQAGENDEAARLCITYLDAVAYYHNLRLHPRERITWLEVALGAARRLQDSAATGAQLGNLGVAYHALGNDRQAIQYHEQALEIARESGDRAGEEATLGNLGLAYRCLGDSRQAIKFHEQALKIAREIGDRRGEQSALGNLGVTYKSLGEYERASEHYRQALKIAKEIGDRQGEESALGNLGVAYKNLGHHERAIEHYRQALQIAQEIGDWRAEGTVLCGLGNVYHLLGERDRAIECHQRHLAIAQAMGDRRGQGQAFGNIGNVYDSLGEFPLAIEYHKKNLEIALETGEREGEGNAHWNMSLAMEKLGKRPEAISHAEDALRILEQIESPHAANVRKALAEWRGQT